MKKIYLLIFSLLYAYSSFALDIEQFREKADFWIHGVAPSDTLYFKYESENEVTLVSIATERDTLEIPSNVSYNSVIYQVTAIGDSAFFATQYLRSQLKQILLPATLKQIGNSAFDSYTGLTSFTMPNSVLRIGKNVFCGCWRMEELTLSTNLEIIDDYAFQSCEGLLSITIPSHVTNIGYSILFNCISLQSIVVDIGNSEYDSRDNCNAIIETGTNTLVAGCYLSTIPNSISKIGEEAFQYRRKLTFIDIPSNVTNIGKKAFEGCSNLDTVICHRKTPPLIGTEAFKNIAENAILFVPYDSIHIYKNISEYANSFAEIKGFSDVGEVTNTTATLKWLPDTAVTQYDINVYTGGALFAHYVVDGEGQIISSQRFAPSIYHHKLDTTTSSTDFFVITLDGLSSGTDYTYTIEGTNAENVPVYHEEGTFTTLNGDEEGFFDAIVEDPRKKAQKIIKDGQLLILRGDKTYTLTGQEAK